MSTTVNSTEERNKDLRMVFLSSRKEFEKGRSFFCEESGSNIIGPFSSLILPKTVIPLLQSKGLSFHVLSPIIESDITLKQDNDLKNKKAILYQIFGVMFFIEGAFRDSYKKWRTS